MKRLFSRAPLLGVVIPAWGVEDYLDDCVRSLVAQTHRRWEAVIVDDGSTDRTGEMADEWAYRDNRISVVHPSTAAWAPPATSAIQQVRGDYLAFLDSDDVLPPTAYADLVGSLDRVGLRLRYRLRRALGEATTWWSRPGCAGSTARCAGRGSRSGPRSWATSSRGTRSGGGGSGTTPGSSWPEGVRYEDQPTTTRVVLARVVRRARRDDYHWRIREGSITQTRASSVQDLADRWETKRQSLASVRAHGSAEVEEVFVDRVLAGDLWRYFLLVPGATEEWWRLLRAGVLELWGQRSLVHSGLPPVHRLAGWLIAEDRRAEVNALMEWVATLDGPAPRAQDMATGEWRLAVPHSVVDETTVDPAALALRDHEVTAG